MNSSDNYFRVPWESKEAFPEKPPDSKYGYMIGNKTVSCSRDDLIKHCSDRSSLFLVWTPETERLVTPADVPFLFEAIKSNISKRHWFMLVLGVIFILAWTVPYAIFGAGDESMPPLFILSMVFVGLVWVVQTAVSLHRVGKLSPKIMSFQSRAFRFNSWLQIRRATYTWLLIGIISVVFVIQNLVGLDQTIMAGGLMGSFVYRGEYWRIITAPMLHANLLHIIMNISALMILGKLIEVLCDYAYLTIVFLASVVVGSIASLMMLNESGISVGCSGGLMGIIGFLAVLGFKRKPALPKSFSDSMIFTIVLVAVYGAIGYQVIDNAGHFGGLAAGVLLGLILIDSGETLPLKPHFLIQALGIISGLLTLAISIRTVMIILGL
ncbi:MAG: rhomboid family intramembrane serine protease [Planctomycetota bacterium]